MDWVAIGVVVNAVLIIPTAIGVIITYRQGRGTRRIAEAALELQRREDQRAEELARERREEARKATLVAHIGRVPGWRQESLVIENRGQSEARDVRVTIDGTPALEHEIIMNGETEGAAIPPHGQIAFSLVIHGGTPDRIQVGITWSDDLADSRTASYPLRV